jgi:hypothetical protein
MKKLLLASVAALAFSAVPAAADTSKIFGNASAKVLTPDANKQVVGKGYYADLYGYYGYAYKSTGYYAAAYNYAYYSYVYLYYAYVYQTYGY